MDSAARHSHRQDRDAAQPGPDPGECAREGQDRARHAEIEERVLLLLANFGKDGQLHPIPKVNQEALAARIGTTRRPLSSTRASVTKRNGRVSAIGDALAMFPASVPAFLICGDPKRSMIVAMAGTRSLLQAPGVSVFLSSWEEP